MGKTSLCIQMLEHLNTGRIYKVSELADLLETNSRNIIEYKRELEDCGYDIISVSGKYGGYKLNKTQCIPTLKLSEAEKNAFIEGYSYLISKTDFLNKTNYDKAIAKITSSFDNDYDIKPLKVVEKDKVIINNKEVADNYNVIKFCLDNSKLVSFDYRNNKNIMVTRLVEPYKLYIYNSNWFLLGYCRDLKEYRYFKLIRMSNVVNTDKKFSKDYFYNESDFFDEQGNKKNSEWFDIKLHVSGYPLVKLSEQQIGRNQKITYNTKTDAVIEVSMQYKYNIISFVLGLGSSCEVLEPQWLIDEVILNTKNILKKYNK